MKIKYEGTSKKDTTKVTYNDLKVGTQYVFTPGETTEVPDKIGKKLKTKENFTEVKNKRR